MKALATEEIIVSLRNSLGRPISTKDVQAATGCAYTTAYQNVTRMHKASKLHIAYWEASFAKPIPFFELGPGRDAEKPAPVTHAQKQRVKRQRARWGCTEEAIERQLNRRIAFRMEAFKREVERLTREAQKAKEVITWYRRRRVTAIPKMLPPPTIAVQVMNIARAAKRREA